MSRLAAQAQAEYYPTPPVVVDLIATYLSAAPSEDGLTRLFDPCVGEGLALAQLRDRLAERHTAAHLETWGVELHAERAQAAATRLDTVLNAPFQAVGWQPKRPVSGLYLNPPYDASVDPEYSRLETWFLEQATFTVRRDGILVAVVPVTALQYDFCSLLYRHYARVQVFRFPGDRFEQFKQVVIFGQRRPRTLGSYERGVYENACRLYDVGLDRTRQRARALPELVAVTSPVYTLPTIAVESGRLWRRAWHAEEIVQALTPPPPSIGALSGGQTVETVLPLGRVHTGGLLTAGLTGTLRLPGELIKGQSVRVVSKEFVKEQDGSVTVKEVTHWEPHLVRVTPDGVEEYRDRAPLVRFLERHADRLADQMSVRLQPYGLVERPGEREFLGTLSQDRPRPGGGSGLYPDQVTTAIAALRSLERHGVANLVCQMGYGKTTVASATLALSDRYPALIMCPPPLVEKWARELAAIIPGVQPVLVRRLADLQAAIANYRPGDRLVVIASQNRIKLGSGWEPAHTVRAGRPEDEVVLAAWRAARTAYREARAQLAALRESGVDLSAQRAEVARLRQVALDAAWYRRVCPDCGAGVPVTNGKLHTCQAEVPAVTGGADLDTDDDDETAPEAEAAAVAPRVCGGAFYTATRKINRWPLDQYILRHARGFFKVLIADESHEYKSGDSDRGLSYGRLCQVIPWTLNLTGTMYGGVASSIFYLLYRSDPRFRREWQLDQLPRWIHEFGRVMRTYSESTSTAAHTTQTRRRENVRELPGISTTVLRYILSISVFRKIKDLNLPMPAYEESVVTLKLSEPQRKDYQAVYDYTWSLAGDTGNYSQWFQWVLSRPNSAFRFEKAGGLECEPVVGDGELLPKEQYLVDYCRAEAAAGRKVIVYARQTGTRDLRYRLLGLLKDAGLRATSLPDNLAAEKREAWITQAAPGLDVFVVNPHCVETGLDLIQFQTIVWYEVEYSLATQWQATSRVWRPGQAKPVKVVYLVYQDTVEAIGFGLLGKKLAAAQLFAGDDMEGALVQDDDDLSMVRAVIDAIRQNERVTLTGLGLNQALGGEQPAPAKPAPVPTARPAPAKPAPVKPAASSKPTDKPTGKSKARPTSQLPLFDFGLLSATATAA